MNKPEVEVIKLSVDVMTSSPPSCTDDCSPITSECTPICVDNCFGQCDCIAGDD